MRIQSLIFVQNKPSALNSTVNYRNMCTSKYNIILGIFSYYQSLLSENSTMYFQENIDIALFTNLHSIFFRENQLFKSIAVSHAEAIVNLKYNKKQS